ASANNFLLQFQADILGVVVDRPKVIETTALGAAYLAGLAVGFWKKDELNRDTDIDRSFQPLMDDDTRQIKYKGWKKAVTRAMEWEE
uniref:FGGY-family carbohydrate kinase n=1 Tax=Vallitalea guaymasensis TaxID=1185412 RepID=UPI00272C38C3